MPTQKTWMRSFRTARGRKRAPCLIYERARGLLIIDLTRDQNFQIVRQRDQTAIKHPVGGTGQRYSVANDIGTVFLDWTICAASTSARPPPLINLSPVMAQRWSYARRTMRRKTRSRTILETVTLTRSRS